MKLFFGHLKTSTMPNRLLNTTTAQHASKSKTIGICLYAWKTIEENGISDEKYPGFGDIPENPPENPEAGRMVERCLHTKRLSQKLAENELQVHTYPKFVPPHFTFSGPA